MKSTDYYQKLGVPENAGINEIKNAFRRKAKEYHPDINKSEGAHEQFVDISEAYSYLMDLHNNPAGGSAGSIARDDYYRQWKAKERQKARQRAEYNARMRFEQFRRSSVYKTTNLLSHMLDYFLLFLGAFIIIAAALGLYTQGLYIEEEGEQILNARGIVANIIVTVVGILFILLSYSNIRTYREKMKKQPES